MAYSDYGGYVYRNGKRVVERSDWTITDDGKGFVSPGTYPGFTALLANRQDVINDHNYGHAVLGTGPFYVLLYKQSTVNVYHKTTVISTHTFPWKVMDETKICGFDSYYPYNSEDSKRNAYLNVIWTHEDNFYVYAELEEPDKTIWHGFSGYGIGAGLENCGYGYDTDARIRKLAELFPKFKEMHNG